MKFFILLSALLLLNANLLPAQASSESSARAIDMEKARALFVKKREGGTLTAEETEYLDRATVERKQGRTQSKPGQRNTDPTAGDNLASRSEGHVPGVDIPESVSPIKVVDLKSPDGVDLSFAYRVPSGEGPHPAILFFHGGGDQAGLDSLKRDLLDRPIQTRFLEQGFVVVQSSRRPFWKSPRNKGPNGFYDAVDDSALIVEKAKALPDVDPDKIVLFGGSGGGILAIVTASKTDVACVIAGEPASVVPLNPMINERGGGRAYQPVMDNPETYFTGERKSEILAWMNQISCPILILQGKPVLLYRANFELLIPEMQKLEKDISSLSYPDSIHGFYWGKTKSGATPELVDKLMIDMTTFIGKRFQ